MESKINATLLEKLFINPTPLNRREIIFLNLSERMFPCKETFIDFLITTDSSEQLELAKYILQRLCFESNFPPSYSLLLKLLDFENASHNKVSNNKYVPQDHFSHIVYTYLLGLYLFFYSPSINKGLTKEFIRKRKEPGFDLVLDATKDFISFWKYFCLFHDIAYPIESSYLNEKGHIKVKDNNIFEEYLENFNKMQNSLAREILLEGAVKYLVVWQMLHDNHNNLPFSNVLRSVDGTFKQKKDNLHNITTENLKDRFGEYKSIDKIHCFEHLKMLTGFIASDDYIIVLFDAFSEQPIALKTMNGLNESQYYILQNQYAHTPENKIIQCLDHEDYLLDHSFFVRYYFKDLDGKIAKMNLENAGGENFSEEDYHTIISGMCKLWNANKSKPSQIQYFEQITTSHDLNTYIFQCYQTFLSYINNLCPSTKELPASATMLKIQNNKKVIQNYLENNFKSSFQNIVIEQLPFVDYNTAEKKLGKLEDDTLKEEHIANVVSDSVNVLFSEKELRKYKAKIKQQLTTEILDSIRNEKITNGLMVNFISQCNTKIFLREDMSSLDFLDSQNGVNIDKLIEFLVGNSSTTEFISKIEKYIQEKKGNIIKFNDFIKQYIPPFALYDHGIYGACVFLLCFQFYEKIISGLFGRTDDNSKFKDIMSTLCWNVESSRYQSKLVSDYNHIAYAVFSAIFCHNLYPNTIRDIYNQPEMKWIYDFSKEPSIYFGMLVDVLQVWNRNKYYQHSKVTWWPQFSSDNYDITIDQNKIVLHVKRYGSINQVVNKFLYEQDKYLKDFSLYVTINIYG